MSIKTAIMEFRITRAFWGLVCTVALAGCAAQVPTSPVGQDFLRHYRMGAADVPLPEGRWQLVAAGERPAGSNEHDIPARVDFAVFVQIREGMLRGTVVAIASARGVRFADPLDRNCGGQNAHLTLFGDARPPAGEQCMAAFARRRNWVAAEAKTPEEVLLYEYLGRNDTARFRAALASTYQVAGDGRYFSWRYEIYPELYGGPKSTMYLPEAFEWLPQNRQRNPQHARFADLWVEWSKRMREIVAAGFAGDVGPYEPNVSSLSQ